MATHFVSYWTCLQGAVRHAVTLAAHVFFNKIGKNTRKNTKNITLRYLLIVVVIKYSLLPPGWRKPEVEMVQNQQFISTYVV